MIHFELLWKLIFETKLTTFKIFISNLRIPKSIYYCISEI